MVRKIFMLSRRKSADISGRRWSKRKTSLIIGTLAATTIPLQLFRFAAAPANAVTCTPGSYRASSHNGATLDPDINGVQGKVYIPYAAQIRNFSTTQPSAGDIYVYNGSDFFQFGWYIGAATGLPYTSVPKLFMGEWVSTSEVLTPISYIPTQGAYYTLSIVRNENAGDPANYHRYFATVNGSQVKESIYTHLGGTPATNGEVDSNCVGMLNDWAQTTTPYPTLQFHRASSGSYSNWGQQYDSSSDPNCYAATRVGGATGTAYDYNTNNAGCP